MRASQLATGAAGGGGAGAGSATSVISSAGVDPPPRVSGAPAQPTTSTIAAARPVAANIPSHTSMKLARPNRHQPRNLTVYRVGDVVDWPRAVENDHGGRPRRQAAVVRRDARLQTGVVVARRRTAR